MLKLEDWQVHNLLAEIKSATNESICARIAIYRKLPDAAYTYTRYAAQDWKRILRILEVDDE